MIRLSIVTKVLSKLAYFRAKFFSEVSEFAEQCRYDTGGIGYSVGVAFD